MWKLKSLDHYTALPAEQRIDEMKHWMLEEISNLKALLRSIGGILSEVEPEIEKALSVKFDELPVVMSELEDNSAANFVVKYRMEHNITTVDYQTECMILNQRDMGQINSDFIRLTEGNDYQEAKELQKYMDSMVQICTILGFEEELNDLLAWRPDI